MLRALFQKHSTHISMRECAAVSLNLDCHRLWAANNSAVKGKRADKWWSGGTPTCYQCKNDGALRTQEKRIGGFWVSRKDMAELKVEAEVDMRPRHSGEETKRTHRSRTSNCRNLIHSLTITMTHDPFSNFGEQFENSGSTQQYVWRLTN